MYHYKLLAPHVTSDGIWLDTDTEVGEDTPYPWKNPDGTDLPPSTQMEGLDAESQQVIDNLWKSLYGKEPLGESPDAKKRAEAKEAERKKQVEEEKNSKPVSPQQAREQAIAKLEEEVNKDNPLSAATQSQILQQRVVSSTATASPTRGGVESHPPGTIDPTQALGVQPVRPGQQGEGPKEPQPPQGAHQGPEPGAQQHPGRTTTPSPATKK